MIPDWGTVLPKADIAKGQAITSKCASCHQFDPAGTNNIGPGLYGVVGRAPGTHPGYAYDSAMQDFAKTHSAWTYDLLYQFLKNPQGFMPGTKMTFVGLKDPQDRHQRDRLPALQRLAQLPDPGPRASQGGGPGGGRRDQRHRAGQQFSRAGDQCGGASDQRGEVATPLDIRSWPAFAPAVHQHRLCHGRAWCGHRRPAGLDSRDLRPL